MNFRTFQKRFSKFGCISVEHVRALYPDFNRCNFTEWLRKGYLVHLRREWYAFPEAGQSPDVVASFASRIYAPAYLSLEYALARHGLIPESVVQFTSVTTRKTCSFRNSFGEFSYRSIKPELLFGYDVLPVEGGGALHLARPTKALLDYLYLNSFQRTEADMENLRLDEEILRDSVPVPELDDFLSRFRCTALERRVKILRKVYGI